MYIYNFNLATTPYKKSSSPNVLVVSDDDAKTNSIKEYLLNEGFNVSSYRNTIGLSSIIYSKYLYFDLIIIDLILPKINILELYKKIKKHKEGAHILIITKKETEIDTLQNTEIPKQSHISSPFSITEFIERCKYLLRIEAKCESNDHGLAENLQQYENFNLYLNEYRVTKNNKDLDLSPKEYSLLKFFIQNPNHTWSRHQILENIWGNSYKGNSKTVDVHIRWLREKIEDEPAAPRIIKTIRGSGYRFG